MNDNQKPGNEQRETHLIRNKAFYIRIAIICAVSITAIILIVSFDAIKTALGKFFSVMIPLFYGILIAYLCNPLYKIFFGKAFKKIRSVHWRKILSITLTYIIVFLIIAALLFMIVAQAFESFQNFMGNLDSYIHNAENFIIGFINGLPFLKSENDFIENTPEPELPEPSDTEEDTAPPDETVDIPATESVVDDIVLPDFRITKEDLTKMILNFFSDSQKLLVWASGAVQPVIQFFSNAGNTILNIFIGFILSIYMLAEKDLICAKARKITYSLCRKKEKAHQVISLAQYSNIKIGSFIQKKLLESFIVGVMAYVAFLLFKIPSPLLIALIVAIMNMIPVFGPFLGAIPAAVLVLIMDPSKTIPYIIIIILIMQINGNYISPKLVGNSTGLTPFGAIIAIILMSGYFGVIGMFIGIPVCAILVEIMWVEIDERLADNNMSTNLDHYYTKAGADVLKEERTRPKRRNITALVVDGSIALFRKIFRLDKKGDKNKSAEKQTEKKK